MRDKQIDLSLPRKPRKGGVVQTDDAERRDLVRSARRCHVGHPGPFTSCVQDSCKAIQERLYP